MADMTTNQQADTSTDARDARNARKARTGIVVSDKMQKTVVVAIERRVPHPVYGKMVTRTKRVKAHDEENSAKTGDTVRILRAFRVSLAPREASGCWFVVMSAMVARASNVGAA